MAERIRNLILGILIAACCTSVFAQGVGSQEPAYSSRTLCFYGYGNGKPKDLFYYASPEKPEPLSIYNWSRGKCYSYVGPSDFAVYIKVPGVDGEPDTYQSVGEVSLGNANNYLILIERILKSSEPGGPAYKLCAVDDDVSRLPSNHAAFYNTMNTTFACLIGEERLPLPPGLSETIPLGDMTEKASNRLAVAAVIREGPKVIMDVDVRFLPGNRYLYVLLPPEEVGSTAIRALKIIDRPQG